MGVGLRAWGWAYAREPKPTPMLPEIGHAYASEPGPNAHAYMQVPTLVGIIPYAAINFSVYETLKQKLPEIEWLQNERGDPVVAAKLACGAVAGGVGQTVVYPLDTVRRRMQVLAGLGFSFW